MSLIKTPAEIEILAEGGALLNKILSQVSLQVKPGVTGIELNKLAEELMLAKGGELAFKNYGQPPYPNGLCVSVNNCVVHGIATNKPLKDGDIVSLDIGWKYKGLYTDMAVTVAVGKISPAAQKLIDATKEAVNLFVKNIKPGVNTNALGRIIQDYLEGQGFGVIRDFVGHGVGHRVHEEPAIPNFEAHDKGVILRPGMVICPEPMVVAGDWQIRIADNGWDALTLDGSLAAHFEETVAVTDKGARVLTK